MAGTPATTLPRLVRKRLPRGVVATFARLSNGPVLLIDQRLTDERADAAAAFTLGLAYDDQRPVHLLVREEFRDVMKLLRTLPA